MHVPGPGLALEQDLRRINERHRRFTGVLVGANVLLIAGLCWGQWGRMALILGVGVVATTSNLVLARDLFTADPRGLESWRTGLNMLFIAAYGHLSGWVFPVWLFLPLDGLWMRLSTSLWQRVLAAGLALALTGFALLDGAAPLVPLGMLLLSMLIAGVSEASVRIMSITVATLSRRQEELSQALQELDLTHRRAREQERLSSLGMLAAGIAHEINNPMSYVKSNLNSLRQELLDHQDLPPEVLEYAVEVLPQTLEGVQRVCDIVADLRRFARGDPEALIPYDLNEEVGTALRITRGRLQAHCEVEVSLEPLQPMLGHPRQISQMVVNLLINAAQAMKQRGRVFVSTRPDGEDDVVLTVRDTGEGMSAEVLGHLFQPFFTTRPSGEGAGMGLAVAHGIVTSHGGRIRVESVPGEGSTFSIRLPRVPPFNFTRPRPEPPAAPPPPS